MKKLGAMTEFRQIVRIYTPSYGAGNRLTIAVSMWFGNLLEQEMLTFLKHYLSRRVTTDTQAVVRGLGSQHALMQDNHKS
jgi:hypothetical protein